MDNGVDLGSSVTMDDLAKRLVLLQVTVGAGLPRWVPTGLERFLGYELGGEEAAEPKVKGRENEAAIAPRFEFERCVWR